MAYILNIKEFITKNLLNLIIIGLFLAFIFRDCGGKRVEDIPRRDTIVNIIHHIYQDTIRTQPRIIVNIPPSKDRDIPYIMYPDSTNINILLKQYDSLLKIHYSKNVQVDSLKIDTFGYVKTIDSVYDNKIIDRQWISNLKIPEITNNITVHEPYKPRNQVYIGGGLMGNEIDILSGIKASILFKNKKDQLYGISSSYLFKYGTVYELNYYRKLKLSSN